MNKGIRIGTSERNISFTDGIHNKITGYSHKIVEPTTEALESLDHIILTQTKQCIIMYILYNVNSVQ